MGGSPRVAACIGLTRHRPRSGCCGTGAAPVSKSDEPPTHRALTITSKAVLGIRNLHDTPTPTIQADIDSLQRQLGEALPSKRLDENLLIATWNLRAFSSLTRKWTAGDDNSSKRDLRGLRAIGEIIRRFDAEIDVSGGLSMDYRRGGFVDFLPYVYTDTGLTKNEISWRVSDHYPLWAEFAI